KSPTAPENELSRCPATTSHAYSTPSVSSPTTSRPSSDTVAPREPLVPDGASVCDLGKRGTTQMRAAPSLPAVTSVFPSGANEAGSPLTVATRRPVAASQIRAFASPLVVTMSPPSGLYPTAPSANAVLPERTCTVRPLATFQIRAVPSWLNVTTRRLSG